MPKGGLAFWASLVLAGLVAFSNAIHHPFVHDDVVFILQDPHISRLDQWPQVFIQPHAAADINTYYRPILEIVYRLEYRLFGFNPYGYHFFNLLVHIINGLLLFSLLQRLNLARPLAWAIALLFLVHPVQSEAVSCVSGISNLWMAMLLLLALQAYLSRWYVAMALLFMAALLSKEQAVMLVPLVMVLDLCRGRRSFGPWLAVMATSLTFLWLRWHLTGASVIHDIMQSPGELYLRLEAIPRVLLMDLRLIFAPYDLHYYRSTDILQPNAGAWAIFAILTAGWAYVLRRWPGGRPWVLMGTGWFLAALLPVLNIVPLINEYSLILTAEHFLYLPIVGILIIAVVAVDYFLKRWSKMILAAVAGGCLLLTWYQNTFWRSEVALFERMAHFEPQFGRGQQLLARAYLLNGQPDLAAAHDARAFGIMSGYAHKATNAAARDFYKGYMKRILFEWGQADSAMGHWSQALSKYQQDLAIGPHDAQTYNNMAFVYVHLHDLNKARHCLEQALAIDPSFQTARRNLEHLPAP